MIKIEKAYKSKIMFIVVAVMLLFAGVVCPDTFSSDNLRLPIGAKGTFERMGEIAKGTGDDIEKGIKLGIFGSIKRIISGGQTGADRGALEGARKIGLETGGVAPEGFITEEGPDMSLKDFGLTESTSSEYPPRTKQNILDSDGTVIFGNSKSRGSNLTIRLCKKHEKDFILNPSVEELRIFAAHRHVLNIAGNRESGNPGIQKRVTDIIVEAFGGLGYLSVGSSQDSIGYINASQEAVQTGV